MAKKLVYFWDQYFLSFEKRKGFEIASDDVAEAGLELERDC